MIVAEEQAWEKYGTSTWPVRTWLLEVVIVIMSAQRSKNCLPVQMIIVMNEDVPTDRIRDEFLAPGLLALVRSTRPASRVVHTYMPWEFFSFRTCMMLLYISSCIEPSLVHPKSNFRQNR